MRSNLDAQIASDLTCNPLAIRNTAISVVISTLSSTDLETMWGVRQRDKVSFSLLPRKQGKEDEGGNRVSLGLEQDCSQWDTPKKHQFKFRQVVP